MSKILDTLYANDVKPSDPSCKTCKNKPKLQESGVFWFAIWMMVTAFYGNVMLFKQLYHLIFG